MTLSPSIIRGKEARMPNQPKPTPAALSDLPDYVAAERVRLMFDISPDTLRALVRRGSLRTIKLPTGAVRYDVEDMAKIAGVVV